MKKKYVFILLLLVALVVMFISTPKAATTWSQIYSTFTELWVGDSDDAPTHTLTTNSAYIKGDVEIDGSLYIDGGISGTAVITATNIADPTRVIQFPLVAATIDTSGTQTVMGNDGVTAPGIAATDGIPAIVYGTSAETASIGWSFVLPQDYSSGLAFRMITSTDTDTTYASWGIDWQLFVNKPSVAFDAACFDQTVVTNSNTTPSASNVQLTFTPDATALADMAAGYTVTVFFWPSDSRASGTIEVKSVEGRYTATQ
uniref:Uncharacterized protein n=1 Tax=viral metagenome TaxID=1070528 RepID=A0A6H1ZG46_9ZZZZ